MNKPKTTEKKVFSSDLFHINKMHLVYSPTDAVDHDIIIRKPTVSIFPLTDKYEIYVVSQYRPLLKKVTLEAVAGYIDEGEVPLKAAKRELAEETGITAGQWEMLTRVDLAASVVKAENYIFLAKGLELGKANPEKHEDIEFLKMPLTQAAQKVLTGEITLSSSIIGILLLEKLRKEKKL